MINIFLIVYLILAVLILVVSGMIIYHIWVYYLNRTLAVLTISFFLGTSIVLYAVNVLMAMKVNWNFFDSLIIF